MVTDETTSLRGREFKLVSPGLCKKDVIALLDSIEESHTASVARLEHVDALHELASRTVEEAQVVAEETRQRLTVEAEAAIAAAIGKAHEQARELVDEARDASLKMIEAAESEAELLRTQALERPSQTPRGSLRTPENLPTESWPTPSTLRRVFLVTSTLTPLGPCLSLRHETPVRQRRKGMERVRRSDGSRCPGQPDTACTSPSRHTTRITSCSRAAILRTRP